MNGSEAPALLHIVGYLTGAALYAMLLVMVVGSRTSGYHLTFTTAVLGVAWNVGELAAHALEGMRLSAAAQWISALSFVALGFLAAVAVHSAGYRPPPEKQPGTTRFGWVPLAGYLCAAAAGVLQLWAAATGRALPWAPGLFVITIGLGALSLTLLATHHQALGRRAVWMTALGLFAVSSLHLSQSHGAREGWTTELLGHHASIPLAFAILYQDYRFGFADLFLKRALTFMTLVAIVFLSWSVLAPSLAAAPPAPAAVGALLCAWVVTALALPSLRRLISAFVDRVVLHRGDYGATIEACSSELQTCDSEPAVLAHVSATLQRALNARSVRCSTPSAGPAPGPTQVAIPTTEAPLHVLDIGLQDGRRLLSDDAVLLDRIAVAAARRIDAIRLNDERYLRMLREREISTLATEAELRALRAQINPHFLFNALTTLGYLIQTAPNRAVDTLLRLTRLLRASLHSEGGFTTLGHELELVESYLQIEHERFEERLAATTDIPPELATLTIPSLIVQPLVENAIKHGVSQSLTGGRITVTARRDHTDGALRITVVNSGAPLVGRKPSPGEGIGLDNVERRLQVYYGDAARLTLERNADGETVAELILPVAADHIVDTSSQDAEMRWPA